MDHTRQVRLRGPPVSSRLLAAADACCQCHGCTNDAIANYLSHILHRLIEMGLEKLVVAMDAKEAAAQVQLQGSPLIVLSSHMDVCCCCTCRNPWLSFSCTHTALVLFRRVCTSGH